MRMRLLRVELDRSKVGVQQQLLRVLRAFVDMVLVVVAAVVMMVSNGDVMSLKKARGLPRMISGRF